MNLSRKLLSAVVITLIALVALGGSIQAEEPIIATINGQDITQAEFYEVLEAEAGAAVLQQMIIEELLSQRQETLGVEVSDDMLMDYFMNIMMQLGGEAGLQQFLAQNQITLSQLEDQIYWNLMLTELTHAEVTIDDDELAAWFEDNRTKFDRPEQIKASHILVDTEEEAQALMAEVDAGSEFGPLAQEHSMDPGSGARGGDLGFFGRGMMVPEFEALAFELTIGDMGIVESSFGWHLILVTDKTEAQSASFEESYDDVLGSMKAERAMDPNAYLMMLFDEAEMEIHSERYQELMY